MGLKDLVKSGVNSAIAKGIDGVAKGIGKGISEAVSDAVEKKVAPTADKLAGQAAEKLNETAASVGQSLNEVKTAADQAAGSLAEAAAAANQATVTLADEAEETESMAQAAAGTMAAQAAGETASMAAAAAGAETAAASQAPAQGSGFASLASALSGIMGSLESAAAEAASGIKICPKCGEGAPAGTKFCPKCGTALPEKTVGELYVCPKCGKKNLPGTSYCVECGTLLPGAEQEAAAQKAKDDAVLASWTEILPDFPVWNGGGSEFELFENDTQNGYPVYLFKASGVDPEALKAYTVLLAEQGFVQPEGRISSESLYKTINGVCRTFNMSNAFEDGCMTIGFYVSDYDKPKTQPQKEEKSAAESVIDGVVAAKKVLGKLFG